MTNVWITCGSIALLALCVWLQRGASKRSSSTPETMEDWTARQW